LELRTSSVGDGRDRGPFFSLMSGPRFPTDEQVAPTSGAEGRGDKIGAVLSVRGRERLRFYSPSDLNDINT